MSGFSNNTGRPENGISVPEALLQDMIRDFPEAPAAADLFRQELRRSGGMRWPEWCFVPMSAWNAFVLDRAFTIPPAIISIQMSRLHALMGWRYSKGIYRFDPEIFELLVNNPPEGNIPSSVLKRLPEWSVYVETPGGIPQMPDLKGFFCSLEYEISERNPEVPEELRLLLITDKALNGMLPVPLKLGDWTVAEALNMIIRESGMSKKTNDRLTAEVAEYVRPLLSLVLWICSDAPEIDSERQPGTSPSRPAEKKVKRGWRIFPASHEKIWTVGKTTGEQLRTARSEIHGNAETTGRTVATHLRRGHWHGYWTGHRNAPAERRFVYRFLHPILVNPQQ